KPVLSETYGIAVYQEQALQIANVMAGYSLGEADILRRAIGKKKKSLMFKEKIKFIKQSRAKGYTKEIADRVWGYIEKFAGYGFNKAHATAYAMIAYQTAYLKVNYPVEFMAALLTAESNNKDKIPVAVEEAKRLGIKVYPPDINQSDVGFIIFKDKASLNSKAIRFGFTAIKNVGVAAIEAILVERRKRQFSCLTDFCERVDQQKVNKKVLESLIQVGAFDAFAKRSQMLLSLELLRQQAADSQKTKNSPQVSLFKTNEPSGGVVKDNLADSEEFNKTDLLNFEKQLLGFYLTDHPLAKSMEQIKKLVSHRVADLDPDTLINQTVTIGGVIKNLKIIITKKGNKEMAFANLDDNSGTVELVIFPKIFAATKSIWINDQPVLVTGKVDYKDRLAVIVDNAIQPAEADQPAPQTSAKPSTHTIYLNQDTPKDVLVSLNQLFQVNPGNDQIIIQLKNGTDVKKIDLPYTINFASIKGAIDELLKNYQ
ncbi:MAG: OB-fold nucleic acid binding domain-containing protein, partial [Candidatus Beckwithbacteria bacterium]|nr:OB-fold nucleic acid binding domain-containing protein [Candidatus Beckwithbacteria bacterium]